MQKIIKPLFLFIFLLIVLILSPLGIGISSAEKENRKELTENFVPGEIIVKYRDDKINLTKSKDEKTKEDLNKKFKLEKKDEFKSQNISLLKITDGKSVEEKVKELKKDSNIEYAEPNYRRYLANIDTNDTYKNLLWALHNSGQNVNETTGTIDADIDWPEAIAIPNMASSSPIIVAIIDSGVAYNHPDLINSMWDGSDCLNKNGVYLGNCLYGYDFKDYDRNPLPVDSSHGTHIAGTIAATKNNNLGIVGVSPEAKIMALRFGLTVASEVRAIDFAIANGAKVINASYVGTGFSQTEYDAILRFQNAGGIFIAAAGNNTNNNDVLAFYPASHSLDSIISVAATNQFDNLASFSNYGENTVDVAAPGTNIYSSIADKILYSNTFENLETPFLPETFSSNGTWRSGTSTSWGNVLYSDSSYSYSANNNSTITSPIFDLRKDSATISFRTSCDTPYDSENWLDYMTLEVLNGPSSSTLLMWDEYTLDSYNSEAGNSEGWASFIFSSIKIPSAFLSENFQFRFRWVSDSSDNNYGGCFIDNIIIKEMDGSGELYEFYNGTSMAAPHVAGLAALIWQYSPNLSANDVKNLIMTSGDSLASLSTKTKSGKRINAFNALSLLDTEAPSGETSLSNYLFKAGDELIITANFSEAMALNPPLQISISGSNEITANMTRASSTSYYYVHAVGEGNGTSTISFLNGTDLAGNLISETPNGEIEFFIDNIAPTIPIIESVTNGGKINLNASSSISISGTSEGSSFLEIYLNDGINIASSSLQLGVASTSFEFIIDGTLALPRALLDGEISLSLKASDLVGNFSTATSTIYQDTEKPEIISVEAHDVNKNGKIDTLKVLFNKNILDSNILISDFSVDALEIHSATSSSDVLNDSVIYFTIAEDSYNTSFKPDLSYIKGSLVDDFDNFLESITIESIDKASPRVITLGDGLVDFSLLNGSSTQLIFSEVLATSSALKVQDVLTRAVSGDLVFEWQENILNLTASTSCVFNNNVETNISDLSGNESLNILLINSSLEDGQILADESGELLLTSTSSEAVIINDLQALSIIVENNVITPLINISSLIKNGSGLIPEITINAQNANQVIVSFSSSTLVSSASSSWDGLIKTPEITSISIPETSGQIKTLSLAIKIGPENNKLNFDKAVRILLSGQTNKRIGFSSYETPFTEITETCPADTQASGNSLGANSQCKINVGSDLVIWTKHFTTFATYTQTAIPPVSSGGGGGFYVPPVINPIIEEEVATSTEIIIIEENASEDIVKEEVKIIEENRNEEVRAFLEKEKSLVKAVDKNLSQRLSGKILLQVESHGEAWYVNPLNLKKYYLGRPNDAFNIMRSLGLGTSDKDIGSFQISKAPARLAGRILLQVQHKGQAFYVNPVDLKLYYLGRPNDAFNIMRSQGLGISNDNLRKIGIEEIK